MAEAQTAVGRIVWHDLNTTDVARAQAFYTELLGWEVETFKPGEMDYPMISANGAQHGGFGPVQGGAPPHWLAHVVVEDVDAAAARVTAAGGTVVAGPMGIPDVGRFAIVRDPQGAVISAFEPAGEATVPDGVFVWDELMTSDVDGAKGFYRDVFGWDSRDVDMGPSGTYTLFRVGETEFAGAFAARDAAAGTHWYPHIGTPDVDASTAKARELGAVEHMGPTDIPGVGRFSVVGDPLGAVFALYRPAES